MRIGEFPPSLFLTTLDYPSSRNPFGDPLLLHAETFMKQDPKELEVFWEKCSHVTENAAGWTVAAILEMDKK